jgi:hypothetical protein
MSTAQVITGIVLLLVWTLTAIPRAEGNSIQSIQSKSDASLIQDAFAVTQNQVSETQNYHAKQEAQHALDALYKGDYRQAFLEKKPELFLKHIAPNFHSTLIDGTVYDAKALQQFFPKQFANMIQTHEHDVTIEDVDVATNGAINAVVTLNTLIEYQECCRPKLLCDKYWHLSRPFCSIVKRCTTRDRRQSTAFTNNHLAQAVSLCLISPKKGISSGA